MDAILAALDAGVTVVTANNRLARSIGLAFARRQRDAGRTAWRTPDVLPWQAWVEQLWWAAVAAGGAAGRRALLTEFQTRLLWRDVVRDAELAPPGSGTAPVAELAARAWRLSVAWRIAPGRLAAEADSTDTRQFAEWAAAFHDRCEAEGCADPISMLTALAVDLQRGALQVGRDVLLAGFDDWTPLQREFLRILAGAGCAVREEPPPRAGRSEAWRVACHDQREELDTAARWARRHLETDPSRVVAVVVPDLSTRIGEVRRAFLDIFAPEWRLSPEAPVPVNFSFAAPLAETGLFCAAAIVLRGLSGSLNFRDAGQLLRTPHLHGGRNEAGARAALDLRMREQIGLQVDVGALARRSATRAPLLAERLRGLATLAARMPRRQRAAAWADTFRHALEAAGWPGDRPLATDEYQAAMACRSLWDVLRGCDRYSGPLTLDGALGLLDGLARDQPFQPAGQPEAAQVLGTLEAIGQRFDALWVCGLTSGSWPPAARPNPLLPLALQRELGMPDSSPPAARSQAERILRRLEASAPAVAVSWPEFDGEEPLTVSPLITHLPLRAMREVELSDARRRAHQLAATPGAEVVAADPAPPVRAGMRLRGGAALLERQARCPARAFLQYRLGAQELSSPAIGIDAATRGSMVHAALHAIFGRIRSHEQLCRLADGERDAMLDEIAAVVVGDYVRTAQPVIRRIARHEQQRLQRLLAKFLQSERERPAFEVLWTEEMPPRRAPPGAIDALGVRLRPDRVDVLPDGRILIIDYKTGRSLPGAKEIWGPRPRSPQLPLYATLTDADGVAFVRLAAGPVSWLGVGRGTWGIDGISEPAEFTRRKVPDWGALRAGWWTSLERLGEEILKGSFAVDRWNRDEASGQWAMATRVHELADDADGSS